MCVSDPENRRQIGESRAKLTEPKLVNVAPDGRCSVGVGAGDVVTQKSDNDSPNGQARRGGGESGDGKKELLCIHKIYEGL